MFVKPFRTKSNVAIKGSDRKRLRNELTKVFGDSITPEEIQELIPNKEEMSVMKLYSHKGENVSVYCLKKSPILFEREGTLYPTVYTAWKHSNMLVSFTTQPPVFEKLHGGADLMLPGVIQPSSGLPKVRKGQVVAVNVMGNQSALAVGYALMSTDDMIEQSKMRGKGIKVMHTFGDHLWMLGDKQQPPNIPMTFESIVGEHALPDIDYFENEAEDPEKDVVDMPTKEGCDDVPVAEITELSLDDDLGHNDETVDIENTKSPTEIMDDLLERCFMTAIKKKLKDSELPLLTSTFYRTHVLPCCPGNMNLDIKKTSYKKLGKYLKHMEADGLIQVKEVTKGNDHIIAVCRAHPKIKSFTNLIESTDEEIEESSPNTSTTYGIVTQRRYEPPEISVIHCVSAVNQALFAELGYKKGDPLTLNEIRSEVTNYVKRHELVSTDQPRVVTLDPLLHRAMFDKGNNHILSATWEDVFKKVISKMQACHQLKFKGMKPIIRTGGPPSVQIAVQQRASNKKVTIVHNLESFLITPSQFAESMRKKAQASTSVSDMPGAANKVSQQVLIQGNQVTLVESLLTGPEYGIPRKYLKGLENAPKSKKKGR